MRRVLPTADRRVSGSVSGLAGRFAERLPLGLPAPSLSEPTAPLGSGGWVRSVMTAPLCWRLTSGGHDRHQRPERLFQVVAGSFFVGGHVQRQQRVFNVHHQVNEGGRDPVAGNAEQLAQQGGCSARSGGAMR